nr:MAG TPA: hypothetical protein [Caudoviricetes sp.]
MRIKLVSKALSYSIDRYVATQKEPIIDVPQEMAIGLVESGSFIALDDNSNSDVNSENAEGMAVTAVPSSNTTIDAEEKEELDADAYDFSKKTVAELDTFANEIGMEYSATNLNKSQKIEEITQFLQKNK